MIPKILQVKAIVEYRNKVGDRIDRFCNHPSKWGRIVPLHEENQRRMLKEIERVKR